MSANSTAPSSIGSDSILRLTIEAATGMMAYFEATTLCCRFASPAYASYYGLTNSTVVDMLPWEIMGQESWQSIAPHIKSGLRGARFICHPHLSQDAEMEVSLTPHFEKDVLQGVLVQLHEQKDLMTDHQLRKNEERMRRFYTVTREAILLHRDGVILDANPAMERLTDFRLDELCGQPVLQLIGRQFWPQIRQAIHSPAQASHEATVQHKKGHAIDVEINTIPMDQGAQDYCAIVLRDISVQKRAVAQIRFMTEHDVLTQLPNRLHLTQSLQQLIASAKQQDANISVLCLDLKHFSTINDSLGHQVGDQVLCEVAQRLRSCVRGCDLVARAGSDEFIVVLSNSPTRTETENIAQKIVARLEMPCHMAEQQLVVSAAIGIAIYPEDGDSVKTLLRNASAARNLAKHSGRDGPQFYTAALEGRASRLLNQEQLLRESIALGGFELHYQPQIHTDNAELAGFEALLRWRHPQRGLISPDEFVALAEARGLITAIDRWVLRQACRQAGAWRSQGLAPVPIAVNMSAREFLCQDLASDVATVLAETGMPAQQLHIELTESTLMHSDAQVQQTLLALQKQGVTLSIDDFGTGYSSLAYLKRHPIQQLKIDRSFITDIAHSEDDNAIVTAIVQMAHRLRLRTVAEGVETLAQFERLRALGCEIVQGFYIAAPIPAEQVLHWQKNYISSVQAQ